MTTQAGTGTAVLLMGHGSRHAQAGAEFAAVVRGVAERLPDTVVGHAYLELARPLINDALDSLRRSGAARVLAVPVLLLAAGHAKSDMPSIVNAYQARHRGAFSVRYGRPLGIDDAMVRLAVKRVRTALGAMEGTATPAETALVLVGRGGSDPDANADAAKLSRLVWERAGLGYATTAFCDVTFPRIDAALEHVARLGFRRVVVVPHILFTGVLIGRIAATVDQVAARHPSVGFSLTPHLGADPLIVDMVLTRIGEIDRDAAVMNCLTCKYRAPLPGFAHEVGKPQRVPTDLPQAPRAA